MLMGIVWDETLRPGPSATVADYAQWALDHRMSLTAVPEHLVDDVLRHLGGEKRESDYRPAPPAPRDRPLLVRIASDVHARRLSFSEASLMGLSVDELARVAEIADEMDERNGILGPWKTGRS